MVKLYKWNLLAVMAVSLVKIYKLDYEYPGKWVHVIKEVKTVDGTYAKLRHWGLLEPKGDDPEGDTKASGYWRITQKGRDFVRGLITVPKNIFIFDNKLIRVSGEEVSIKEALGKKFSYAEMMDGYQTSRYQETAQSSLF